MRAQLYKMVAEKVLENDPNDNLDIFDEMDIYLENLQIKVSTDYSAYYDISDDDFLIFKLKFL